MASIVLAGATSGSTTIQPTDAVTVTVTLPTTGGTLQTSGAGFTTNGVAYATSTSALATGSGLQFDGTNLSLGTSPSSVGGYKVFSINNATGGLIDFRVNGTSTGYVYTDSAGLKVEGVSTNPIIFKSNGAEVGRFTSAGNLDLTTAGAVFTTNRGAYNQQTKFYTDSATGSGAQYETTNPSVNANYYPHIFKGTNNVPTTVEYGRFNQFGLGLGGANPTSGTGIAFPATQSASSDANTLDDYEEGSWTPGLTSSAAPLSATIVSVGRYTKIGNFVVLWGYVSISAISSATGSYLRITGLPFSFAGSGLEGMPSGSFGPYGSFTGLSASDNLVVGASSTTELNIWIANGNGSYGTGVSGGNLQAGTSFYFSITGRVA